MDRASDASVGASIGTGFLILEGFPGLKLVLGDSCRERWSKALRLQERVKAKGRYMGSSHVLLCCEGLGHYPHAGAIYS